MGNRESIAPSEALEEMKQFADVVNLPRSSIVAAPPASSSPPSPTWLTRWCVNRVFGVQTMYSAFLLVCFVDAK